MKRRLLFVVVLLSCAVLAIAKPSFRPEVEQSCLDPLSAWS